MVSRGYSRGVRGRTGALIFAAAAVASAVAYVALWRRPPQEGTGIPFETERALAKTFKREVAIAPLGLTARMPDSWKCTDPHGWTLACGEHAAGAWWDLRAEPRTDSIDQLASEVITGDSTVTPVSIAGFDGHYAAWSSRKRPESSNDFYGWTQHPTHGRLRLSIHLRGADLTTAEAVMLTTAVAPSGLPAWWPESKDVDAAGALDRAYAKLADDKLAPKEWPDALGALTKTVGEVAPGPAYSALVEPVRAQKPSVAELVKRRVDALIATGDVESYGVARSLVYALKAWDRALAIDLYATLAERAKKQREAHPEQLAEWVKC